MATRELATYISAPGHAFKFDAQAVQVPTADTDPQPCTKKLKELNESSDAENHVNGLSKMASARLCKSSLLSSEAVAEPKTHVKVPGLRRVPRLRVAHQGVYLIMIICPCFP